MREQLLIMPFDHRSSLIRDSIGVKTNVAVQKATLKLFKEIIYAAFLIVQKKYPRKNDLAILVDEKYGAAILKDAKKRKIKICYTVEKSGGKELAFEYGNSFGAHIAKFQPDFVKVLVRYNPSNKEINKRQLKKLKRLGEFCEKKNYRLLLELLVPPTKNDLAIAGSLAAFDKNYRIKKTVDAIGEIKKAVKVDVWKMEGFDKSNWRKIFKVVPEYSKIIVLGRGENEKNVMKWIMDAKIFSKIIGFAVGRTIFLKPLLEYHKKRVSKKRAEELIAADFSKFVKLWNS
ncbi:MAG TPA: DUF2090 domain-containing protein [Candidatus Bipolaricaulota bacterium]|nr:DUF2090 domain-containing protein [Candidatus Bipolaricaulota bacterium]